MAVFDLHKELNKFYDEHVRLTADQKEKLVGYRDSSLERVAAGLRLLGEERDVKYKTFTASIGQGSYTMHTLNQHPNDEYDIDEALIFAKDDLPAKAADARQLIADALVKGGGNFRKDPEARTNAVTVWYADGAHVDFAIYREVPGFFGSTYEHAGGSLWSARPPKAVTDWFKTQVEEKSPEAFIKVDKHQLRRVVRWVKAFARSRISWSLPGGMILTVLVAETYVLDRERDDVSLYRTLKALKARLDTNLDVRSPIDNSVSLTAKAEFAEQVKALLEKLDKALVNLAVLEKNDCTRNQALRAWGKVFNHDFWGEATEAEGPDDTIKNGVANIELAVTVARAEGGRGTPYKSVESAIAKGRYIGFSLPLKWQSLPDVTYRWEHKNTGDEARRASQMGQIVFGGNDAWRLAAYKGVHSMTCEILRGGTVIARGVRRVQVARW